MLTRETVACLGSSSTAGKGQAFDWISELARRPCNARYEFHNFGVGGDLAYDALRRIETVLAVRPDHVIVWVGGNDALTIVSPKARRLFRILKLASRTSSQKRFQESLSAIVQRTKSSGTRVALCSLAPIGEAPSSEQPFQAALNSAIRDLSAGIRQIALAEGAEYIPIFEAFQAAISADPGRAFTEFRLLPMYRDAFRTLVLRMSTDEVGRLNGWKFHSDGIHLNRRGGMIAVDHIQSYLSGWARSRGEVMASMRTVLHSIVSIALCVISNFGARAVQPPDTPTDFVGRQGVQLVLNHRPWRFLGYND